MNVPITVTYFVVHVLFFLHESLFSLSLADAMTVDSAASLSLSLLHSSPLYDSFTATPSLSGMSVSVGKKCDIKDATQRGYPYWYTLDNS